MAGKILVIRGGAIGDFILTLPAVRALRQRFPTAHLELLGYPHIVQLAVAGNLVNRVQPIEARELASFFARDGELPESWRDYFSEFDIILSYLYDPDAIFQTNVRRCCPGQFITGPHRPDEARELHAAKVFLQPLERLAIYDADCVPQLVLDPLRSVSDRLIALHPGSGSERKNWAEANWARLIEQLLTNSDLNLLVVGGEAEGERLQRLTAVLPPARVQLAWRLPLAELAFRLKPCLGFVGHDSGITHLAAAVGLPCVVLWADTVAPVWRPLGNQICLVRDPAGISSLSVAEVWNAVTTLWLGPAASS